MVEMDRDLVEVSAKKDDDRIGQSLHNHQHFCLLKFSLDVCAKKIWIVVWEISNCRYVDLPEMTGRKNTDHTRRVPHSNNRSCWNLWIVS